MKFFSSQKPSSYRHLPIHKYLFKKNKINVEKEEKKKKQTTLTQFKFYAFEFYYKENLSYFIAYFTLETFPSPFIPFRNHLLIKRRNFSPLYSCYRDHPSSKRNPSLLLSRNGNKIDTGINSFKGDASHNSSYTVRRAGRKKIKSIYPLSGAHPPKRILFLRAENGRQFACDVQFTWRRTSNDSFFSKRCSTTWRLFNGEGEKKRKKERKGEERKNWNSMNRENVDRYILYIYISFHSTGNPRTNFVELLYSSWVLPPSSVFFGRFTLSHGGELITPFVNTGLTEFLIEWPREWREKPIDIAPPPT